MSEFVDITGVRVLGGFVLELTWADGAVTTVDVEPYLWGPVFEPLRDPAVFATVAVDPEAGTVVWPNGADISPEELRRSSRPVRSRVGRTPRRSPAGSTPCRPSARSACGRTSTRPSTSCPAPARRRTPDEYRHPAAPRRRPDDAGEPSRRFLRRDALEASTCDSYGRTLAALTDAVGADTDVAAVTTGAC